MELKEFRISTGRIIEVINTVCDFEIGDRKFFGGEISEVNVNRRLLLALIEGELHYERVLREDEYDYKYVLFQQDRNVFDDVLRSFESFEVYYDEMDEMQGSSDTEYEVTELLRQLAYGNVEYLECITDSRIRVVERPDYEEMENFETFVEVKPKAYEGSQNEEFQRLLTEIVDEILPTLVVDKNYIIGGR